MEKRKNYMGFHIPKIWQILKCFTGAFSLEYIHIFKFLMSVLLLKKCCEINLFFPVGQHIQVCLEILANKKIVVLKSGLLIPMFVKGIKYDFE